VLGAYQEITKVIASGKMKVIVNETGRIGVRDCAGKTSKIKKYLSLKE